MARTATHNAINRHEIERIERHRDANYHRASLLRMDADLQAEALHIETCLDHLEAVWDEDAQTWKLRPYRMCGQLLCSYCKGRYWRTRQHNLSAFRTIRQKHPSADVHKISFSPPNVAVDCLRAEGLEPLNRTVTEMFNRAPLRCRSRGAVQPLVGYYRQTEVTRGSKGDANQHVHLVIVTEKDSVAATDIPAAFTRTYGQDVEFGWSHTGMTDEDWVGYCSKPPVDLDATKDPMLARDGAYVRHLCRQMKGSRTFSSGGEWKDRLRELKGSKVQSFAKFAQAIRFYRDANGVYRPVSSYGTRNLSQAA